MYTSQITETVKKKTKKKHATLFSLKLSITVFPLNYFQRFGNCFLTSDHKPHVCPPETHLPSILQAVFGWQLTRLGNVTQSAT